MRLQIDDGDHIVVRGESPFSLRVAPRVVFAMTSSCLMPMKTLSHRLLHWSRTAIHEPLDTGDRAAVLRTQAYDRRDRHALHVKRAALVPCYRSDRMWPINRRTVLRPSELLSILNVLSPVSSLGTASAVPPASDGSQSG